MNVLLERAYDDEHSEGVRILVDRVWPRGVSKKELGLDDWLKDVAPSTELRKWFDHDVDRWDEFKKRYFSELKDNPDAWKPLVKDAERDCLVLIYGAKDREHNQAVALREFLKAHHS